MTNTRTLVSRNKREGWFWHGIDEKAIFKMRLKTRWDGICSLKTYGQWVKKQNRKGRP